MSTPPPAPPPPPSQKHSKDKSSSGGDESLPSETGKTSLGEEEEFLGPDEEAPSLDDEDETSDDEAPPKDEEKPRRKRGRRRDRKKRRKDKKKPPSEDADEETSDKKRPKKREKPEKPKELKKPKSYEKAGPEVQAYMDRLQGEEQELNKRNKYLIGAVVGGVLLLLLTFAVIHRLTTGSYAVLENIEVKQNPTDKGRLTIKYDAVRPGKVRCVRTSGGIEHKRVDTCGSAGNVEWSWSQGYQPGKNIDIAIEYRGWLSRRKFSQSFPTTARVDIVVLMDTTPSMGSLIAQLGEKDVFVFASKVKTRGLNARYALVSFGGRSEIDDRAFTKDVMRFHESIKNATRFDGGGAANSALAALERSLKLKLDKNADRCFYLVTNAPYQEPTQSGATAEKLAEELKKRRVQLRVFSKPEYEKDYAKLLDETGRFMPIQSFGQVIREGRILGD